MPGLLLALALAGPIASPAAAQGFEHVGNRARGMAGAFVAVADDATATWWNPAGLPGSLIFDGVLEVGRVESGLEGGGDAPGRAHALAVAVAFPVAGVSYARVRQWRSEPVSTAALPGGRQEGGRVPTARSLLTQHVGFSLAQSLGDAVVVGVTARAVRGGVSAAALTGDARAGFDAAADAPLASRTQGDLDVGVLVRWSRLRLGFAARNLAAPAFTGEDGATWTLGRRARAGVAVVADADRAGRQVWVVAADADLTKDDQVAGGWRGASVGLERWFADRRLALRGGVEGSTAGRARTAATGGVSVAVPGGFWIEASGVAGASERRGWGLSAHVMF